MRNGISTIYRPFVLIVVVLLHNYWKTDMVNNYVSDVEFRDSSLVVSVCTFILFYLISKIQISNDDDDWYGKMFINTLVSIF